MERPTLPLLLVALPALIAGWLILAAAEVGTGLLTLHAAATASMLLLAVAGRKLFDRPSPELAFLATQVLALLVCGFPLLGSSPAPERWLKLGPLNLYAAAVVLPLALVAYGHMIRRKSRLALLSSGVMVGIAAMLAAQPDAAQILALSCGTASLLMSSKLSMHLRIATLASLLGLCLLALIQPDPLLPVPYVEGVFELALGHSVVLGAAVVLGAVAFVTVLFLCLRRNHSGMSGLALYYVVLFGFSVLGQTPAPLIGFGAGPLLGYGLMVAALAALGKRSDRFTPV